MVSMTVPKLEATKNGWRARKVIPADVRHAFGKREVKVGWSQALSLADAKRERDRWNADLAAKIAAARAGRVSLSDLEVNALAAEWYRNAKLKVSAEDDASAPGAYDGALAVLHDKQSPTISGLMRKSALEALQHHGMAADEQSIGRLADALLHLHRSLYGLAKRHAEGDYSPDPQEALLPPRQAAKALSGPRVLALFERWAKHPEQVEANAASTLKRYRGVFKPFAAFLGNPIAAAVTGDDVARYFEHRLEGGLRPFTARNVHRAALSSVFGWAQGKRIVGSNPVAGYKIKARAKTKVRDKSFTDAEATTVLSAARAVVPSKSHPFRSAARRWVPILCAYTGARVQEMAQLRKQDVRQHPDGFYFLRLAPEAGTIKDRDTRDVPLHPSVVAEGFLAFVKAAPDGPLFFDPKTRRRDDAETPLGETCARALARWVRTDVGVVDPNVAPNHAWRHRFKTAARLAGVEGQYADAITGHIARSEGDKYGEKLVTVLYRELSRIKPEPI